MIILDGRIYVKMDYGYQQVKKNRGFLVELHIADLHFGAMNPEKQYNILMEQFYQPSLQLQKLDIIAVDGDIFDHRVMSNSDVAMYATKFIDNLVHLAEIKNATLVIIAGTYSHDYDQLKLFYHYMDGEYSKTVDVRIITTIQFEMIKGARILCIPELYGIDESVYQHFFFESGWYDAAFIHGTFKGSVYGNNAGMGRLLIPEDFIYCEGVAISGHIHKSGCFNGFYYYCGCPYRWKFGEEEDKGFLLLVHDLDTQIHYVEFKPIISDKYITISVEELSSDDPQKIIDKLEFLRSKTGAEYVKVKVKSRVSGKNKTIINQYYKDDPNMFVEFLNEVEIKKQEAEKEIQDSYNYLVDDKISDLERFVMFVNNNEGEQFITVDKLKDILKSEI